MESLPIYRADTAQNLVRRPCYDVNSTCKVTC